MNFSLNNWHSSSINFWSKIKFPFNRSRVQIVFCLVLLVVVVWKNYMFLNVPSSVWKKTFSLVYRGVKSKRNVCSVLEYFFIVFWGLARKKNYWDYCYLQLWRLSRIIWWVYRLCPYYFTLICNLPQESHPPEPEPQNQHIFLTILNCN